MAASEAREAQAAVRRALPLRAVLLTAATALLAVAWILEAPGLLLAALAVLAGILGLSLVARTAAYPWDFERAMLATHSEHAPHRRTAAGEIAANSERLTGAQSERAALRMADLTEDADDEVRWMATKALAELAPRVSPAKRAAVFERAAKRADDPFPKARGAAAMAIAALTGGEGGVPPERARRPLEKLMDDPDGAVRLWALDGVSMAAPRMPVEDRLILAQRVMRHVTTQDPGTSWKAGRTLVAITSVAESVVQARVVEALLEASARVSGEAAVHMIDLAAEVRPQLSTQEASNAVAALVALAERDPPEVSLRALRAAALFSALAPIEVGNDPTQALARMATAEDPLKRDGALLCLGAIGAWAGTFGKEVQARGALDVARNLALQFKSGDPAVRRWARDLWPIAYRAVAPNEREGLLRKLLVAHADAEKNVRWAASATITSLRLEFTPQQAAMLTDGVLALLSHADGDTKRHATVTLVELFEVLDEPKRAEVLQGLRALAGDPDRVVADQAKDSVAAIGEFREKAAKAAAR